MHARRGIGLHNGAEPPPKASPVARHVFLDGRLDQFADVSAVKVIRSRISLSALLSARTRSAAASNS